MHARGRAGAMIAGLLISIALAVLPSAPVSANVIHEADFLARLNLLRATNVRTPLIPDHQMTEVARAWSRHMAQAGAISHNPNVRSQVGGYRRLGENVGMGGSVASIHGALEASPGHRANMLDPAFLNVGIGVVESGGTLWVTQVFKQPSSLQAAVVPPPPEPAPPPPPAAPPPGAPAPAPAPDAVHRAPAPTPRALGPVAGPVAPPPPAEVGPEELVLAEGAAPEGSFGEFAWRLRRGQPLATPGIATPARPRLPSRTEERVAAFAVGASAGLLLPFLGRGVRRRWAP